MDVSEMAERPDDLLDAIQAGFRQESPPRCPGPGSSG
jgi:hypothetical protein